MPRIISLAPSNTEILASLGALEDVIAISEYCDYPAETRLIPKLKGWSTAKRDEVTALSPDLVLLSTICQAELENKLHEDKIPTLKLDPTTLDAVANSFLVLGEKMGRLKEAQKLFENFKNHFEQLKQKIPTNSKFPRVYVEEWSKPPMVSGNWVPEIIENVGGIPFPLPKGGRSREIQLQEIQKFDPEIIFLSICGRSTKADPQMIVRRNDWGSISAVKNQHLFSINDSLLNRPGPRLNLGAHILQSVIGELYWGWERKDSPDLRNFIKKGYKGME